MARLATGAVFGWVRTFVRQESIVLVSLLLIVGSGWGFLEVMDEIEDGPDEVDIRVMEWLRGGPDPGMPIGPDWLITTALDLTALGSVSVLTLVVLLVVGYLALQRAYGSMWLVVVTTSAGGVLTAVLKDVFGRARPDEAMHLAEVSSASFPSGHAMSSAFVYLTLGAIVATTRSRLRERVYVFGAAVLLTSVVGVTRVYLGVHYVTDVAAGWSLGLAWALVCLLVAHGLRRRRVIRDKSG